MRTTVDLPADLHALARAIAADQGRSMSEVIADLIRRGLETGPAGTPAETRQGVPLMRLPRRITTEDVRSLDDE